jgi:G3E family GTPase
VFADALVVAGATTDAVAGTETTAVLDRLAPGAPRTRLAGVDPDALLAAIPSHARLGRIDDAHGPLLRGQPPLEPECGVSVVLFSDRRPFHPERLHTALDVLLDGVVQTRARVWVASQPDVVLWLESAGGGMRVGQAGPWLAALAPQQWERVDPERRAMASLRWDPYYGDRHQEFVVVAHKADPTEITAALHEALLTDEELAEGEPAWRGYADPFGQWHTDPCGETDSESGPQAQLSNRKEEL